ncbi:MAG: universal stress protein [Paracoccaceae bacterium]
MAFKSIITIVTDFEADKSALAAAEQAAQYHDGHLTVICLGLDRTQPGFIYAGYTGADAVVIQSNMQQAREDADSIAVKVRKHLQSASFGWAAAPMSAQSIGLTPFLAHQLRFADLVVVPRPYGDGRGPEHEEILEASLFNAHVPVLVVPPEGRLAAQPGRIVLAWNESAEALNATRAAMPLLRAAEVVDIVIIDPPHHGPDRSDPGGALSQMLARHGARAEVSILAKTMPRISEMISRHVRDKNADMVVMGAYGHSRFRQSILGGATRNMLEMAEVPVLMAH